MTKLALITGVTGQSGSYLAELLLEKGYEVLGLARRTSAPTTWRISHLAGRNDFKLLTGDVSDTSGVFRLVQHYKPDEIYNLAAMSHVGASFNDPIATTNVVLNGCLNFLEAIRATSPATRFYQASSSEMFGASQTERTEIDFESGIKKITKFQNESTPFMPNSPYAVAKLAAHNFVRIYRESYGLLACGGILFNHESPRRGDDFVTSKIIKYAKGLANKKTGPRLQLGNIDSVRDWGYAPDYVRAMWLMLQQPPLKVEDFVIGTGKTHSVRDFLSEAFRLVGIAHWEPFVDYNVPAFTRPLEVNYLCADASKARHIMGWEPTVSFEQLVYRMLTGVGRDQ